ncbi:MAG: protein kinase [Myxococcales bacterium]|nr:protein kinase [Myxococcales bacterium]
MSTPKSETSGASGSRRLGRYLLLRSLAAGGMGEIFLAEHTGIAGFAKRVALKRIRPELARDPNYVRLFLNEARLGSFLNHPNIVHIFDVGHAGDDLWLVMEYVDGVDLKRLTRRARLSGRPLTPVVVAAIMVDVLSALEEAHGGGPHLTTPIIHRDISPENVVVARSGAVKVLDFGLAKYSPESDSVPSLEGDMIFGKVRYMPPEQLKGQLIDARADLFSLGVVMYEVLQGDLPFGRGNANQVLAAIMAGPPPSPTQGQDPELDAIIFRALEPYAQRRYANAQEMRRALVQYMEHKAQGSLPLEGLRRRLQRGAPGVLEAGELSQEPPERAATEIALSVAERCGKCGEEFTTLFMDGMIVDRCSGCRGVWLDPSELDRIIDQRSEHPTVMPDDVFKEAPLDRLVGSCPTCRTGLESYRVPGQPAHLEVCAHCLGVWFDHDELRLLAHDDVVTWLRGILRALEAHSAPHM